METNELIFNRIKEIVHQNPNTQRAYLFGSRARGDFRPDSDWDILILVNSPKLTNELEDTYYTPLYDLEVETSNIISPLIYTQNWWDSKMKITPLYYAVSNEGINL